MVTRISQRELRNDNADIVRRVERGERFVVTRNGVPVAELLPYRPTERRRFVPVSDLSWLHDTSPYDAAAFAIEVAELDAVLDDADRDAWDDAPAPAKR